MRQWWWRLSVSARLGFAAARAGWTRAGAKCECGRALWQRGDEQVCTLELMYRYDQGTL